MASSLAMFSKLATLGGSPVEDAVISVFPDTPSAKDDEGV
jgi:hypothetical protein